jgi:hypothetical protein
MATSFHTAPEITHAAYWEGAQLSRGVYLTSVFLGMSGLDHLFLRSPLSGLFKLFFFVIPFYFSSYITLILKKRELLFLFFPVCFLFSYWYVFDIAQAFGEKEFIEKYGIAIPPPFGGPTGIGAGMIQGTKDPAGNKIPNSPDKFAKPYTYAIYFFLMLLSIFTQLPFHKLFIGDINGFLIFFPFFYAAIIINAYDIFTFLWTPKDHIDIGIPRPPIISYFIKAYYNKNVFKYIDAKWVYNKATAESSVFEDPSGNKQALQTQIDLQQQKIEKERNTVQAGGGDTETVSEDDKGVPNKSRLDMFVEKTIEFIGNIGPNIVKLFKMMSPVLAAKEMALEIGKAVVAKGPGGLAKNPAGLLGLKPPALPGVAGLAKIPGLPAAPALPGVATALTGVTTAPAVAPAAPAAPTAAPAAKPMRGGALENNDSSIPFQLFTVSLLAFSGYVFYVYKNTFKIPEKSDDPPR